MGFRGGKLSIHDWPKLCAIGEFDSSYLHLKKPAR
jgi:hypothetical protein